jgi:hypothetical protein
MLKPPAEISYPTVKVAESPPHDEAAPSTLVMPVTADTLTLLHDRIEQDSRLSDEASKQCIQKCVEKIVSAVKISCTK